MSLAKIGLSLLRKEASKLQPPRLPPKLASEISGVVDKVVKRFLDDHHSSVTESVKQFHKIKKSPHQGSILPSQGDIQREAYHLTLHSGEEYFFKNNGIQQRFGKHMEEHGSFIEAFTMHQIRSTARKHTRRKMSPEDAELLRARDTEVYGNPDGPTFEFAIEKVQCMFPDKSMEEVLKEVCKKGKKTSKEYDAKFGIIDVAIHVSPGGIIESQEQRMARVVSDDEIIESIKSQL